jgi:hypothetical protein
VNEQQFEHLINVLTRIANALEQQASAKQSAEPSMLDRVTEDARPFLAMILKRLPELEGKTFSCTELFVAIGHHQRRTFEAVSLGKAARAACKRVRNTSRGARYVF